MLKIWNSTFTPLENGGGHTVAKDYLAVAIRAAVGDEKIQEQALALGGKIQAENGVQTAVSMIEGFSAAR